MVISGHPIMIRFPLPVFSNLDFSKENIIASLETRVAGTDSRLPQLRRSGGPGAVAEAGRPPGRSLVRAVIQVFPCAARRDQGDGRVVPLQRAAVDDVVIVVSPVVDIAVGV